MQNVKYLKHVVLDIHEGKVMAIQCIYNKSVRFESVRKEVDYCYGKWAINDEELEKDGIVIWRVSSADFSITLTRENNEVQLVFTKWLPWKRWHQKLPGGSKRKRQRGVSH